MTLPLQARASPLLVAALVWTMVFSTIQLYTIAVLASEIRQDLGISRAQIGLIGAANTGVGALLSPVVGRFIDGIGAKRGAVAVLAGGGLGMLATAAAPTYGAMLAASVVAGLAQSGGNPSTNKLIALHVRPGARGAITGVKQSGVTLALFLCGLTLPGSSSLFGWRTAVAAYGLISLALALVAWVRLPGDIVDGAPAAVRDRRAPLDGFVFRIALYGFLMGVVTAGILRFLPLYAEEELGYSETVAGLAAAVVGLAGIVARITWGRLAENRVGTRAALVVLAALAATTTVLLAVAPTVGAWLLWPIALLTAFSAVAWNAVGNLAIIRGVGIEAAGRATGVLLLGFLMGLTIGAPMVGAIVDATDRYPVAWAVLLVTALAAGATVLAGDEPPAADAPLLRTAGSRPPGPG